MIAAILVALLTKILAEGVVEEEVISLTSITTTTDLP